MTDWKRSSIDETTESRLASKRFWRYWQASAISRLGDGVTVVALPLTAVSVLHASAFQVSLLTAAVYASWFVIGLPAGVVVQRLPLRETQIAMDLLRGLALLSIPLAVWLDSLSIAQLVLVATLAGLASVVFDVGNSTFLVSVVSRSELAKRNSLLSGTDAVAQLAAGPSLGGLLVQVLTGPVAILVDVTSFFFSASLLSGLPRPRTGLSPKDGSIVKGILDGCRYVSAHPVVRPCAAIAGMVNFICGGVMALTPVYLVRTLDAPPAIVGVLFAAEGVGSFLGAAATPRLAGKLGSARAVVVALTAGAISSLLIPLAFGGLGLVLFFIGSAGLSSGIVVCSVLTRTHRQQTTPPELLARVMATVRFFSWSVIPLGALFAGGAASLLGARMAFALVVGLTLLVPAFAFSTRLRRLRDLDQYDTPARGHDARTSAEAFRQDPAASMAD